jgi:hypothetical protein
MGEFETVSCSMEQHQCVAYVVTAIYIAIIIIIIIIIIYSILLVYKYRLEQPFSIFLPWRNLEIIFRSQGTPA